MGPTFGAATVCLFYLMFAGKRVVSTCGRVISIPFLSLISVQTALVSDFRNFRNDGEIALTRMIHTRASG